MIRLVKDPGTNSLAVSIPHKHGVWRLANYYQLTIADMIPREMIRVVKQPGTNQLAVSTPHKHGVYMEKQFNLNIKYQLNFVKFATPCMKFSN